MSDTPITHIKAPTFPEFRFEWHQAKKIVYLIRATAPTHGSAIALDINTEGGAHNAVLIFLRGYREAKGDLNVSRANGAAAAGAIRNIEPAAG